MKKMILSLTVLFSVLTACNTEPKQTQKTETPSPIAVVLNDFESQAANLVDKLIVVKGTCLHTCKHGGGKMFISSGDSAAYSLKVIATDETGNFNAEMEGSEFEVVGTIDEYRIDAEELERMEKEIKGEDVEQSAEQGACTDDHAKGEEQHKHNADEIAAQLAQVAKLREKLETSGKAYLSFYSLKAVSYKPIKE